MERVDGWPVGVVRFTERMDALSCAVLNGGASSVSALFVMQVPKDYDCSDPVEDAERVRDALGLPEDTLGMMTAAEVDHVFNVREAEFGSVRVAAVATAGLSNHVVAGEYLDDYEEKSEISAMRAAALEPGTINVCVVSPVPLNAAGMVNLFIPLVEAKSVAMAEHGFLETGTTSDAMAVLAPHGDGGLEWTGTGSPIGIAAARAVTAAVGHALDVRDEHPQPMGFDRILGKLGLTAEDLRAMSGCGSSPEEYRQSLDGVLSRDGVSAAVDIAWSSADRLDSLAEDGRPAELELMTGWIAGVLGVDPPSEGGLLDRLVTMMAEAGARRWQRATL